MGYVRKSEVVRIATIKDPCFLIPASSTILVNMSSQNRYRMPLLEVRDLVVGIKKGKKYLPAVEDIRFQMYPGEIVGIVGESGCGKTLTARSIPGLLPQGVQIMKGNIVFNGAELRGLSQKELCRIRGNELSMVFQEPMTSLNPLLTIGRQIGEPLALHGGKDCKLIYRQALDIMRRVGL